LNQCLQDGLYGKSNFGKVEDGCYFRLKKSVRIAAGEMTMETALAKIDELKAKIDVLRPLDAQQLASLHEYFKIGLTYSSNALEGNSLTLIETKIVIEDGLTIGGKPLRDHLEAQGHSEAFDHLFTLSNSREITESDIRELHRLFYRRIEPNQAGEYRTIQIYLAGSDLKPPRPIEVPELMNRFAEQIPEQRHKTHPVLFAAWLHYELVTIHPFIDGNGRTARLLLNLALLQDGYPHAIIPPIRRAEYLQALESAQTGKGIERYQSLIVDIAASTAHEYWRLLN